MSVRWEPRFLHVFWNVGMAFLKSFYFEVREVVVGGTKRREVDSLDVASWEKYISSKNNLPYCWNSVACAVFLSVSVYDVTALCKKLFKLKQSVICPDISTIHILTDQGRHGALKNKKVKPFYLKESTRHDVHSRYCVAKRTKMYMNIFYFKCGASMQTVMKKTAILHLTDTFVQS